MHTINKKSTKKLWAGAIAQPGQEFPPTQLLILSGKIPHGLQGTLYRNGPARLERGGLHMGHWFDGDGAILAVHFTDAGATAVYRYVQSDGYKEEAQAGTLRYGNYGMTAPGPFWNQWLKPLKNAANTSVLVLPDKLLALWEA
ncbi:MAG: carotenoid oxygenase family protein, partial [Rhizonema sp. PD38]|nr:carotenoid oxygenase family protein [Rhizonema sp. PD38]